MRNNVYVFHSFYSVTAQLQLRGRRQAPFNSEMLKELGGGKGAATGFFYTLSHVLPAPWAAIAFFSSSVACRHLPPHPNMMHKWY